VSDKGCIDDEGNKFFKVHKVFKGQKLKLKYGNNESKHRRGTFKKV